MRHLQKHVSLQVYEPVKYLRAQRNLVIFIYLYLGNGTDLNSQQTDTTIVLTTSNF